MKRDEKKLAIIMKKELVRRLGILIESMNYVEGKIIKNSAGVIVSKKEFLIY